MPVKTREFRSIEFRTRSAVPEWDGQLVPMPREEDAWIDDEGQVSRLTGPQTELWLVGAGR